jgi:hypothetical protein
MGILSSVGFHYQDRRKRTWVRGSFNHGGRGVGNLLMCISLAIYMADIASAAQRSQPDAGQTIAKLVDEFFATQPGYENGDLIRRSQVEQVVGKVLSKGVKISEPAEIVKRALPDDSFMIREFSTPNGKHFMRRLAQHPDTFSHLDRLSTIPRGQQTIHDLMGLKDGDKLIEYMATTKGGRNMGAMMVQVRGGVDLNKPTGRIYTAEDLVEALHSAMKKTKP